MHIVLLKCPDVQIAFLKFASCDNQALIGCIPIAAVAEIIKIGQLSHKMYSNNIVNFQECTTILNTCTKKSENLLIHTWNNITKIVYDGTNFFVFLYCFDNIIILLLCIINVHYSSLLHYFCCYKKRSSFSLKLINHYIRKANLLGIKPCAMSSIFLFFSPSVCVPHLTISRMLPSILQGRLSRCLFLQCDSRCRTWFRKFFLCFWGILILLFLSSLFDGIRFQNTEVIVIFVFF